MPARRLRTKAPREKQMSSECGEMKRSGITLSSRQGWTAFDNPRDRGIASLAPVGYCSRQAPRRRGCMRSPQEAAVTDVAALPRIGGMATMPGRVHTFRQAVDTILPQVDRLFIFFDKFERVPADLVADPKIVPLLASTHGNVGARGKFLALEIDAGPCLYF